jgi:hypothetical protein
MLKKTVLVLCSFLLLTLSALVSLLVCKIIVRKLDGYPIFSVRLDDQPRPGKSRISRTSLNEYFKKIPLADNADAGFIFQDPPPVAKKDPDPFWVNLLKKVRGKEPSRYGLITKEWNRFFVREQMRQQGGSSPEPGNKLYFMSGCRPGLAAVQLRTTHFETVS